MNKSKDWILVTGGAGFIGSCLSRKLIEIGYNVVIVDNLSTGSSDNIPTGSVFIEGNVQDSAVLAQLVPYHIICIFHFSAQSSGEISFDDPVRDLQDNVQSTLMICDFMRKNNIPKIIYSSSMIVYGSPSEFPCREEDAVIEQTNGFYGLGKFASENYLRLYENNYDIKHHSLRFQTIYGPGQNMKNLRQGMVSIFIEQILKNYDPVVVKGALNRFRDLLHIDDLVNILVIFLEKDIPSGVVNCGTGIKTTFSDVLKYILDATNTNPNIVSEGSTPGDIFGAQADMTRLLQYTGYQPKITPEVGVKEYARWYFDQINNKSNG